MSGSRTSKIAAGLWVVALAAVASRAGAQDTAPPPPLPPAASQPPVAPLPSAEALPPSPPPASSTTPHRPDLLLPAYIAGGLAVVSLGVGAVFGVVALQDQSTFNKTPSTSTQSDALTHALDADMALGAAVVLGVTSVVWFLRGAGGVPPAAAVKAAPGGAGVAVRF